LHLYSLSRQLISGQEYIPEKSHFWSILKLGKKCSSKIENREEIKRLTKKKKNAYFPFPFLATMARSLDSCHVDITWIAHMNQHGREILSYHIYDFDLM